MIITPPRLACFGLRAAALASLVVVVACDKRGAVVSSSASTDQIYALTANWPSFAQKVDSSPAPKIDLLFMVDNSSSMLPLQAKLVASFSSMMTVLQGLPGGVPDLHIGVVSSDLGAGNSIDVPGCNSGGGDRAVLQSAPRDPTTCARIGTLNGRFLSVSTDSTGAMVHNWSGDGSLADAFTCIGRLGDSGCGIEQQLASAELALDPVIAPPENAGFVRSDAYLGVVLITNEDDCSAPYNSPVFQATSKYVSDPLGPLTSFRCNRVGHECRIGDGPWEAPIAAGTYTECRSNENGPLDKVGDFVTFLRGLKGDPARVFLGVIAGPPTPYVVTDDYTPTNDDPAGKWPQVSHSCTQSDGTYADPSVRLWQTVEGVGERAMFESICNDSMGPALTNLTRRLVAPLQPPCVVVPDPGPGCTVVDRWQDADGTKHATRLPACSDAGATKPCFSLANDATCGTGEKHLVIDRSGTMASDQLYTAADCTTAHP
ncbi:MAG TPA: hypothetical protein VHJ20_04785 [Polyangia bacterium]|nr:hypothetical protein [Polyangia bacterium]